MLATLTAEEVGLLENWTKKVNSFPINSLILQKNNNSFVPSWVKILEAKKNFGYFKALLQIDILFSQLSIQVAVSVIEAYAELLDAVNDFYKAVQQAQLYGLAAASLI